MRTSRAWWALSGLVAGALGLAMSYAAAALLHVRESPVVAVAEGFTAITPGAVVKWAINTFDRDDKKVLVVGILLFLAVAFALLGRLARRRWWAAVAGYVVLAGVAVVAVATKPTPAPIDFAPVVVGLLVWVVALAVLAEWLRNWELVESEDPAAEPTHTRRHFFVAIGGAAALAGAAGLLGRIAGSARRRAEESRRLLRIEGVTAPAVPDGASFEIENVAPWQTPSDKFYLIDTTFIKPAIEPSEWSLRIHGMVDREITLSYRDLVERELTQDWITLNCVSNPVGGNLIGNAWWSGVRLVTLLAEARPQEGADAVLQTSEDGWTCLTPLAALTDRSRNAMLAVAMNGEPLPIEHGFPVRTIVPGLYGYVSATKWVVDLEVTRFDDAAGYWTDKGWAELGPVKLASRIDLPHDGDDVPAGELLCAGTAWLQHTGISGVQVQVDGGPWTDAELATTPNLDTWVQWRATVRVDEGDHQIRVRAIDLDGGVQTGVVADVLPDGATGWHTIDITAKG